MNCSNLVILLHITKYKEEFFPFQTKNEKFHSFSNDIVGSERAAMALFAKNSTQERSSAFRSSSRNCQLWFILYGVFPMR